MLLPGVSLFPHTSIPLHIFEDRYKKMFDYAVESEGLFAIATRLGGEGECIADCVNPVGVLGVVESILSLEDGRKAFSFHGVGLVRFKNWLSGTPYPLAEIDSVERVSIKKGCNSVRKLLLEKITQITVDIPSEERDSFNKKLASMGSITSLIDFIAHYFVNDETLKLKLLSSLSDGDRASDLLLYLENE